MIDQVPCAQCGAPVSESSARRMNGLCISCKMKRTRTDPFHVFYNSLIDRVQRSRGGFDMLSEPEKLYFTVMLLRNEVNNGGFHQYFINSFSSYYGYTEKGLVALGATHTLDLLRQAKDILFPTISVPVNTELRRRVIPIVEPGAPAPEWANKLDELDGRFYADSENLTSRLKAFAREQGFVSEQQGADI